MSSPKHRSRIFYGWWVVFACAVIQFYIGGTFYQGFSALFNPIASEFDWSYAAISLAFTFRGFEAGFMAPIVGIMVDRFGPKRLMLGGIVLAGFGFWFFSRVESLWTFYGAFLFLALGLSFATGVVTMTAVARWFTTRRSLAMGILTSGFGAAGLMMPLVVKLVDSLGWRESSVIFAVGTMVLCFPLVFLIKEPPADGQPEVEHWAGVKNDPSPANGRQPVGTTFKNVMRTRDFWFLSMAILFGGMAGQALIVHQMPYMTSVGLSRETAGFLVMVLSASNVAGRLLFGFLGDMLSKRPCYAICAAIKTCGVMGLAFSTSPAHFIPSLIAIGVGFGGLIPLRPGLQVESFGMTAFATVQGLLMISITIGTVLSPIFAGWIFDTFNSYRPAFIILALATLVAIPMVLSANKHRSDLFPVPSPV